MVALRRSSIQRASEFRVWQARRRLGAQAVNVPGAWNFSDLHTSDTDAAKTFYGRVFGWEADDSTWDGVTATMWRRPGYGDHLAATIDPDIHERQQAIAAPTRFRRRDRLVGAVDGAEVPHWHVTLPSPTETTAWRPRFGWERPTVGPIDTDWTRSAVIRDPQGATLTLSQFTPGS